MKFLVSILLLSTIIGSATSIHFAFTATINCPLPYWCVQLKYYTNDIWHDNLGSTQWKCSYRPQQKIVTHADLVEDVDGYEYYDLKVGVKHNCEKDGKTKEFGYELPSVLVWEELAPINYTLNLA